MAADHDLYGLPLEDFTKARNDLGEMRTAINRAWELLPPDKAEAAKERAAQSGLRGT